RTHPSRPLVPYTTLFRSASSSRSRVSCRWSTPSSSTASSNCRWKVQWADPLRPPPTCLTRSFHVTDTTNPLGVSEHSHGADVHVDRKSTRLNSSHVSFSY